MKNLVRTVVPLIIGAAIGFFVCKEYFCPKIDCSNCPTDCSTCPSTGACAPTSEAPSGIISTADAIRLHETYVAGRYSDQDFKDTQFVWFDYNKMKQYIGYLEEIQQKNPNNLPISGIRVYFGAYDASHNKYAQQQTVFFTPTIDTKLNEEYPNMKNLPFSILPTGDDPLVGRYKVIGGLLLDDHIPDERMNQANISLGHRGKENNPTKENIALRSSNAKNGDNGTSLSMNDGQLSPPPPKG